MPFWDINLQIFEYLEGLKAFSFTLFTECNLTVSDSMIFSFFNSKGFSSEGKIVVKSCPF